jgi:hypothetical protein
MYAGAAAMKSWRLERRRAESLLVERDDDGGGVFATGSKPS